MDLAKVIETSEGRFFTVEFVKKDGSTRILNGRLGVEKYLKGGECTLDREKFVIVYDVQAKGYRAINRETIISVKFEGVKFCKGG
jgi:hypothetical protein